MTKLLQLQRTLFLRMAFITVSIRLLGATIAIAIAWYLWPSIVPLFSGVLRLFIHDSGIIQDRHDLIISAIFFIVTAIVAWLMKSRWLKYPEHWCSEKLLPVNLNMNAEDLNRFERYNDAVSARIQGLLPKELTKVPDRGMTLNMIPLSAEEVVSIGGREKPVGKIRNLLFFLDCEFFLRIREHLRPITVQGEPGSGKSTLVFELYHQHADRLVKRRHGWIPILVFAHEFSWEMLREQANLKEMLISYFRRSAKKHDESRYNEIADLLEKKYEKYQWIIIIDGLDEIPNRSLYVKISKKFNTLLEDEWKDGTMENLPNRHIVSCRTEDNQRLITSRIISLFPLEYNMVLRHLKRLRRYYKALEDDTEKERVEKTLKGLSRAKTHRLLQNYVRNPYLLSLILRFYEDIEEPPAKRLDQVFEHVLERELRKPRNDFESPAVQKVRVGYKPYLRALLAPYCFRKSMDSLASEEADVKDFKRYLEEDSELQNILFGYLRAVFYNDSEARENRFVKLIEVFGNVKTEQLRALLLHGERYIFSVDGAFMDGAAQSSLSDDERRVFEQNQFPLSSELSILVEDGGWRINEGEHGKTYTVKRRSGDRMEVYIQTDKLVETAESYEDLCDAIVHYLHKDIVKLVRDCGLAEVDMRSQMIGRFRHRRMQDYFMARFLDKVGVDREDVMAVLDNAWMREPIRILAAVSNEPHKLLGIFDAKLSQCRDARASDELDMAANLALNTSEAIAYLPKPENMEGQQRLHQHVVSIGRSTLAMYNEVSKQEEVHHGAEPKDRSAESAD